MLVTLIFISFLLYQVRGFGAPFSLFSSLLALMMNVVDGLCGRGSVREHLCEPTRTGETGQARRRAPEGARASAGRGGAVHPRWIPRNRPRAALGGALTRSAATCEGAARSLPPTVRTRPAGSVWRGGSARQ